MTKTSKTSPLLVALALLGGFVLMVGLTVVAYRPDRPVANLVPGSSSEPTFVVQVIRPRAGLPLGGLLSPQLFGLERDLVFDSKDPGAQVRRAEPRRLEFVADDWELSIVRNEDGGLTETYLVFELIFEERATRVRCRPAEPAVGRLEIITLDGSPELSGSFDIELAHCENVETGKVLGWPPQPLVLHGSFDRLPPTSLTNDE